ncbi:sentrin-specific protease-like [Venturia canescens]|uniref:sentrin-specific protease-like n=1 Tax=Venturia canescens TaxID=32260 RepID=UPI001C9CDDD1|nr:sentrin-specific protease-like [Venturia canescens]
MLKWFQMVKMIFDFLKRIFGLVDEESRKRPAEDVSDDYMTSVVSPKKHCCDRVGTRIGRSIYADENEEEEIEYLGQLHYSPTRSKELLNGKSCTKRKFGSGCQQQQQHIQTYSRNFAAQMNGKEQKGANSTMNNMSRISSFEAKCSTLTKTNQLREKQEYGQLLQRFLPVKSTNPPCVKAQYEAPNQRRQAPPLVDLSKTPIKSTPETSRERREVFATPVSSTPVKWYTPKETKNDGEISIISARKSLGARPKNDGISILKMKTQSGRVATPIVTKVIPTIRLDEPKESIRAKETKETAETSTSLSLRSDEASTSRKSYADMIQTNTLRDNLAAKAVMKRDFVPKISSQYNERREQKIKEVEELKRMTCLLSKRNRLVREAALEEQLTRSMRLCEAVLDETEELDEAALPELTPQMLLEIKQALIPNPPNQVLVESFGLRITRKDIHTLSGLNWLNDEVINFYMNLLIVRGTNSDKYPKVHAMNTFFYPKLLSGGHSSLKRWTRKVDVFAQDLLVVPIHLGIHWCMSIIDFRNKTIRYFDSMGGSNPTCLNALQKYLEDESLDKKKKPFDTSGWKLESVTKTPQQMNGSDCGVFSCMFAEYITANRKITFTQQDMPYFRNKMVYEILKAKLL